ncbi:FlgD Ig-like domain-containing protein [Desulfatibacillum alkenivorans DSM 16219]|uniref:FlgD Ig-like domain-containing protein n=1 Tax=Desulfatibacillum alkenivorans DSM 16219 TaxID=1121393 RepID=A0A1M6XVK2_9BACT|nr:FlgD immunoglobulin-like domain containing protein [Desulfatibacillum alkenivorans]SHL09883.1 FlgD Ig-like domain-containing protein [Desulfatibacillum alkenivorans DSM 16219]
MRTATRVVKSLLAFALMLGIITALQGPAGASAPPVIDQVSLSQSVLVPGEAAAISYRLAQPAQVTAMIYTPDYQVVRVLMDGVHRSAGINSVAWDGKDDSGAMVPNEAYLISLQARDSQGNTYTYDPTAFSGGEKADIQLELIPMAEGYNVQFTVQEPVRVNIRAGIHNGPFLASIVNWAPYGKGTYTVAWNGLDSGGSIRVMEQEGAMLLPLCFKLPVNSILVQGSSDDYVAYAKSQSAQQVSTTGEAVITVSTVRKSSLKRASTGISTAYLVARARHDAPKFTVNDATGAPLASLRKTGPIKVSSHYPLTMEVTAEDVEDFYEGRYEIVVFVDNERFDEEESAQTPYTYVLDTTSLENGVHEVTFNLVGLGGQTESYSFTIEVYNE